MPFTPPQEVILLISNSTRVSLALAASLLAAACGAPASRNGPSFAAQATDQVRFGPLAIPGVDGPLATTQPGTPGEPWAMGPPVVATTAELMARGSGAARDRSNAPRLIKIRPDRRNLPANPFAPAVAQWPPSPFFPVGGPSAAFAAGAPNVNIGVLADTGGFVPPDTMGDVGPTQYVLAMNGRVRAVSKATGLVDPAFDLDSDNFFAAVANGQQTGDPRVRFDRRAGRWYILMFNIAVPNRYLIAVSSSATITAGTTWQISFWNNTRTQAGAGCLGDYPTLGVDEDALYVGVNQFCGAALNTVTFDSTSVYVLNRANLLAGAPTVVQFDGVVANPGAAGPATPQGVDNFDDNTNEGYFIGVDNASFGTLMLRRVINPASQTPSLSGNVALTVPTTTPPKPVPQPGPNSLDGLDDRLMNAVVRNGRLWTLHQNEVSQTGVSVTQQLDGRNGQRWYEIGNLSGTPNLVQAGTVFDPAATNAAHHWMGSIMVNGQGHAAMGMSRSGAAAFANTVFTGRLANAPGGTMEPPTQYSDNTATVYNVQGTTQQRWGDYSYTSVDPNDDMTMWTLQEFPNASNSYAVRLIRLLAPPPAAILSLSPSSVATGLTGVNVTVTGTSSAGSGFFDPGAGFVNRLSAAFSGAGVTVTNVAFASPTSLTLTLNTVGAATGARTLTVTNPDGQQASRASALTITAPGVPPVAPSNLRILAMAGNQVTFAWTLPTTGPTPTGLRLEGGLAPGAIDGFLPLGVTPSATVALPTGSFFIRLRTIAGGAVSGPSNELLVHVNVPVTPSPPANLLGMVSGSAVQLAWTPTFGGGAPTGGQLDVTGTFSLSLPLGGGDTFSFPSVPPGTFTFRVRQTNAGGASAASNPVTLTFPGGCTGRPQAATQFVAFKSGGVLFLHWDPPASGPAPSTYVLVVTGSVVGSFPMIGRSFSVPPPPGSYTLSIVTTNACGPSAPTPSQTVSFP